MKEFRGHFLDGDIEAYRELGRQVPVGGSVAEIGVMFGKSLQVLCELFGINYFGEKIYAIDTWDGTSDEPDTMALYKKENVYGIFLNNIREAGYNHIVTPVRMDSLEAAAKFQKTATQFDLIFLDSKHEFNFVREEIDVWMPNLKPGGTISGHDLRYPNGVAHAVYLKFGKKNVQTYKNSSIWSIRNNQC